MGMVAAWAVQGRTEEEARGFWDGKIEGKQMNRLQDLAFSASSKRARGHGQVLGASDWHMIILISCTVIGSRAVRLRFAYTTS
jgi:hypothetical protein